MSTLTYINMKIASAAFYGANTTSVMNIVMASNTLDSVIAFAPNVQGAGAWQANMQLGGVLFADTLRVQALVLGTGYLYLV